jgi:hypothetical protein
MRNYANIATAIWRDPDFIALSGNAQRTYMLLITQHDISSVGTLAITLRRWARMASDSTQEVLSDGLDELERKRFIAIDWEHEELLVRTFVKWDGGHTNPKRMLSIQSAAKAVTSPILGPILDAELTSLGVAHAMSYAQIDSHSDADPMAIESPRVVVTEVATVPTHNPVQQPSLHEVPAAPPEEIRDDVDKICLSIQESVVANGIRKPTITKEWRREARLLLDKDGYDLDLVMRVLDWSLRDNFWKGNIQSAPKFREKFSQLLVKSGQGKSTTKRYYGKPGERKAIF